jgi:glutathione S-transferase
MPTAPVKIVGSYLSPYVRKVLVCLQLKGIPYEIDPIVPYYGNDAFAGISPLRRIPVLMDGDVTLSDSTVICEYLDERTPEPPLMPRDPASRARARWLEEFADSRMGEVFIWHLYNQLVIRKFVWGQAPDAAVLDKALTEELPQVMDYLEAQAPDEAYLFGTVCIADIAIAAFFRNLAFCRRTPDAERWPKTLAYISRTLALPAFHALEPFETLCLRTPISEHRTALIAAGAPITSESYGTATPRSGILST